MEKLNRQPIHRSIVKMFFTKHEETIVKSLIAAKTQDVKELEARFQQPIDPYLFKQVFDHYTNTPLRRQKFVSTIIESPHNNERTLASGGVAIRIQKTNVQRPLLCSQFPVKIVLAFEKELERWPFDVKNDHTYPQKIRWRFQDGSVYIDLTEIRSAQQQSYQIEVEVDDTVSSTVSLTYQRFLYALQTIHRLMMSIWPPHSQSVPPHEKERLHRMLQQPNNRRFPGVLPLSIQNQTALERAVNDPDYAVSLKLDGKRFILLIEKGSQCYLMDRSMRWVKVKLSLSTDISLPHIFDVEIVDETCYILDVLSMAYQHLPHRLAYIKQFVQRYACAHQQKSDCLMVVPKVFYLDRDAKRDFLLRYDPLHDEHQDGLIFTAINKVYHEHVTDCYKWKLPEQTSIDFTLKKRTSSVTQVTYTLFVRNDDNQLVPFGPCPTLSMSSLLSEKADYDGAITECYWNYITRQFVPKCIRHDKQHPNHIVIAKDAWQHILSPSSLDLLPSHLAQKEQDQHDALEHLFGIMKQDIGWQDEDKSVFHLLDIEALLLDKRRIDPYYHWYMNDEELVYSTRFCLTDRQSKIQHWFPIMFLGRFVSSSETVPSGKKIVAIEPHSLLPYTKCIHFAALDIENTAAYQMSLPTYAAWVSGQQPRLIMEDVVDEQRCCEMYKVAIGDTLVPTCPYVPNMQYTFVPHITWSAQKQRYERGIKAVKNCDRVVI